MPTLAGRRGDMVLAGTPVLTLVAWIIYWPAFAVALVYPVPALAGVSLVPFAVAGTVMLAAAALVAMRHARRRWLPLLAVLVLPFLATLVLLPAALIILAGPAT